MSEPLKSEFSARLRRVPGQLLLALTNGTAILVIAAAILAVIAASKVTHLAQNVASTTTDAVLSRVGGDPRWVVQTIQRVSDDVRTLVTALEQVKIDGVAAPEPEIEGLNERLSALEANIEQLRDARSRLIEEVLAKVGSSVNEWLQNFTACPHEDVNTPGQRS